jgi:hypothetical protein
VCNAAAFVRHRFDRDFTRLGLPRAPATPTPGRHRLAPVSSWSREISAQASSQADSNSSKCGNSDDFSCSLNS